MEKIDQGAKEFKEMDELSFLSSPIHSLHPLTKLAVTVLFIFTVTSFNKYDLFKLFPMVLYPVFTFQLAGISMKECFYKLRYVLPLVMMVGVFNPFFDKQPFFLIGNIVISSGFVSMLSLMLKGALCVMASFIMVATTRIDSLCHALNLIHVPKIIVELVLLTYRYISIMMEELSIMNTAYKLRAPGQKGIRINAWGSFLGQLLLRCMDRADELYMSMQLRGYNGTFRYASRSTLSYKDAIFVLVCIVFFVSVRLVNITLLIGNMFVR